MDTRANEADCDVIVVGSGAGGATLSRELARQHKKVLLLERGTDEPLVETLSGTLAIAREFRVGPGLNGMEASTVGGSTSLYFAKCIFPNADTFRKLGIDLSHELEQARSEFTIAALPDEFLAPQAALLRDSARALGYGIKVNQMLIDRTKCAPKRYSYEAKWKARNFVSEAVERGARLITRATATSIVVENGRAIGVEYSTPEGMLRTRRRRAYAKHIVLAAGALTTPKLLIDAGITNVGDQGFFCHPAFIVCGTRPGLKGRDAFIAHFDLDYDPEDRVVMGDATMNAAQFKLVMLGNQRWRNLFAHASTLSLGVAINDEMGGRITSDGRYDKQLTSEELALLRDAEQVAVKILKHAGARSIYKTKLMAGIPGGVLRIGEHLDETLQTRIPNLYVCDHSVIRDAHVTPTVLLTCLGRYLAKQLIASLDGASFESSHSRRLATPLAATA
jgi:hypothetical protein